jgi:hypothetical protein
MPCEPSKLAVIGASVADGRLTRTAVVPVANCHDPGRLVKGPLRSVPSDTSSKLESRTNRQGPWVEVVVGPVTVVYVADVLVVVDGVTVVLDVLDVELVL